MRTLNIAVYHYHLWNNKYIYKYNNCMMSNKYETFFLPPFCLKTFHSSDIRLHYMWEKKTKLVCTNSKYYTPENELQSIEEVLNVRFDFGLVWGI